MTHKNIVSSYYDRTRRRVLQTHASSKKNGTERGIVEIAILVWIRLGYKFLARLSSLDSYIAQIFYNQVYYLQPLLDTWLYVELSQNDYYIPRIRLNINVAAAMGIFNNWKELQI